jgi:hypothetical protein
VVTQFEFALYPVGPEILAGLLVFPIDQAKQVLQKHREFVRTAPEELNIWVVIRKAPPLPFLPENPVFGAAEIGIFAFRLLDPEDKPSGVS